MMTRSKRRTSDEHRLEGPKENCLRKRTRDEYRPEEPEDEYRPEPPGEIRLPRDDILSLKRRTGDEKRLKEKEKEDIFFNVKAILSTPSRQFLVNSKNERVPIDALSGKHVLLLFWLLKDGKAPHQIKDATFLDDIVEMYKLWNTRGLFEVVFVAVGNNKPLFDDSLCGMMWLAVPHEDTHARDILAQMLPPYDYVGLSRPDSHGVLFDPQGRVLLRHRPVRECFREFGPEGFPFTQQAMDRVSSFNRSVWKDVAINKSFCWGRVPLTLLIGIPYVESLQGNRISTIELESKIVAFFCFSLSRESIRRTKKLLRIWNRLKSRGKAKEFEIVLFNHKCISHQMARRKLVSEFGDSIPWYILPVDGRHLFQMLRVDVSRQPGKDNSLIIIESARPKSITYFAWQIYDLYGLPSYPFTLEKAVMLEKKKQVDALVLPDLLSPEVRLSRKCADGSDNAREETTLEDLLGKRILLLFASSSNCKCGALSALMGMYNEQMGPTDDHFEIIYMSLDDKSDYLAASFPQMWMLPWVCSLDQRGAYSLASKLFKFSPRFPAAVAFGPDGHLETREDDLANKSEYCLKSEYPFIPDMEEVVLREINVLYGIDVVYHLENQGYY